MVKVNVEIFSHNLVCLLCIQQDIIKQNNQRVCFLVDAKVL